MAKPEHDGERFLQIPFEPRVSNSSHSIIDSNNDGDNFFPLKTFFFLFVHFLEKPTMGLSRHPLTINVASLWSKPPDGDGQYLVSHLETMGH